MGDIFHSKLALKRICFGFLALALAVAFAVFTPGRGASAASVPSGETSLGQSTAEPAWNDMTGTLTYINTPNHARMNANPRSWAPIYIPVYPLSAASAVGPMNCAHSPLENCPDHGPLLASVAASIMPGVYGKPDGSGVWGHDHLLAPPGSGGDFNIAWEPVLVLFTNSSFANSHVTTLARIKWLVTNHEAILVPLPQATFHCEVVPAVVWTNGTPVTPVAG